MYLSQYRVKKTITSNYLHGKLMHMIFRINMKISIKIQLIITKKNRFQSARIAALCLHNIQRENLVFKKSLSIMKLLKQKYIDTRYFCLYVS